MSSTTIMATVAVTTTLALAILATIDYRDWIAFGTGGTSPNIRGYLKISVFRLLRLLKRDSLKDASMLSADGPTYLIGPLQRRSGPPPRILGRTLPQRQYPEPLDPEIRRQLHDIPSRYAARYPELLRLDWSVTEGRSTHAIYAKVDSPARAHDRRLGDEIAHVHPAENSLHVWLTAADAKKVVEAGWGERFPLASLGMVDGGLTFLYAPRSLEELEVIDQIVRAGIGHLTGARL